jgi:hypothetical protein
VLLAWHKIPHCWPFFRKILAENFTRIEHNFGACSTSRDGAERHGAFRLDAEHRHRRVRLLAAAFLSRARNVIARAKKFLPPPLLLLGVLIKQQNPIKRLPRRYFSCCCCSAPHSILMFSRA